MNICHYYSVGFIDLDYFVLILMHLKTLKEVSKLAQTLTWTRTVLV